MAKKYPLHEAIKTQNFASVRRLLDGGNADVEEEFETAARYMLRPVHFAVEYGFAETAAVIDALRDAGADMNAKTRDVRDSNDPFDYLTPLYMAADTNHMHAALALLNCGAKPQIDCLGWTPLHRAAEKDGTLMISLLVSHGAVVNARNPRNGLTPLHSAVVGGGASACCALWMEGADMSIKDNDGLTPLDLAVRNKKLGAAEMLRRLASLGGLSPKPIARYAETLHAAIQRGGLPQAEAGASQMASKGAIDFPLTSDGLTGLHWSALLFWPEGVELMLGKGANPNVRDHDGWTPLMCVAGGHNREQRGEPELPLRAAEMLLDAKTDIEIADDRGRTALMLAIKEHRPMIAKVLLDHGANVHAADKNGDTILMYAARAKLGEIVELLLAAGADQEVRNAQGQSACELSGLDAKVASILESWRTQDVLDEVTLPGMREKSADEGRKPPKGIL